MDTIITNLRDPSWWFTAVFMALLASVVAGFVKDYLERRCGVFMAWSRCERERRRLSREDIVRKVGENEGFLILASVRALFVAVFFVGIWAMVCVYIAYLHLKYNIGGLEEAGRLHLRQILGLCVMFAIFMWAAFVFAQRMSLLEDCMRHFRKSRGLPKHFG